MERLVRVRLIVMLWCLAVSVGYLMLAEADSRLAEGLLIAFVALLIVPVLAVETWVAGR